MHFDFILLFHHKINLPSQQNYKWHQKYSRQCGKHTKEERNGKLQSARLGRVCKKAKEKYPVSRGFSLAWLLAFTILKSFVSLASSIVSLFFIPGTKNKVTSPLTSNANNFVKYLLKAMKERNLCLQGKEQGSSFPFLPPRWLGAQCLEPVKPGCLVYDFNGKAKIS